MADEWEETVSGTGDVYFVNKVTQESRWAPPDPSLPEGWESLTDEGGQVYYVDHATATTTFVDPRVAPTDVNPGAVDRGYGLSSLGTDDVTRGLALDGRVAVVTGGNSGMGLETAIAFARMGATVILACRTIEG